MLLSPIVTEESLEICDSRSVLRLKGRDKRKISGKLFVVIVKSAVLALDLCPFGLDNTENTSPFLSQKDPIYFPIWNLN